LSRVLSVRAEGTFQMKSSARSSRVAVSGDGRGLVSQAGVVLLWETMRVTGLGRGLSAAREPWRAARAVHDPGKIVADLGDIQPLRERYLPRSGLIRTYNSPRSSIIGIDHHPLRASRLGLATLTWSRRR
jgi:hypothetical protein